MSQTGSASAAAQPCAKRPDPLRFGQINIREIDPPGTDVEWWADEFRRTHLDGVCINAGGFIAYYPTEVPYHFRSPYLGNRDLFSELTAAAKAQGMWVLARVSPGFMFEPVYRACPDWFMVTADGGPRCIPDPHDPENSPPLYYTCITSDCFREFVPAIFREIASRYDIDAFFGPHGWDGTHDVSYCPRCQRLFREASGLDLPRRLSDPARKAWRGWRDGLSEELWLHWDRIAQGIRPALFWWGNNSVGAIAKHARMFNADAQTRGEHTPLWLVGEVGKRMRSVAAAGVPEAAAAGAAGKPYFHIGSAYVEHRQQAKPDAEQRIFWAESLAADCRPWFTVIGTVPDDLRQFPPLERAFTFHARHEDRFLGRRSMANVALVWSDRQAQAYEGNAAGDTRASLLDAQRGAYYALLRARIPFDMLLDELIAPESAAQLARYDAIVLPNRACLSDGQCAALAGYAAAGGSLVVTYETSLYDDWGAARPDFGLADILGVHFAGEYLGPYRHARVDLGRESSGAACPFLEGIEHTRTMGLAGRYAASSAAVLRVQPAADTQHALTVIPSSPWHPPETAYPHVTHTDWATVFWREREAPSAEDRAVARSVYFAAPVDRILWHTTTPDLERLIANAVRWALHDRQPVRVDGPGLVDVHAYRRDHDVQVHLVNLSNPDIWHGPCREILPVGAQQVRVSLPAGSGHPTAVRLLVSASDAAWRVEGQDLIVDVSHIDDHEIVVAQLG